MNQNETFTADYVEETDRCERYGSFFTLPCVYLDTPFWMNFAPVFP
jgi:hypothetical protein